MRRVAIYARVSTEKQERSGTIESQVAQLRAMAGSDGEIVTAADEYLDDGISGTTLVRPALERLRDRVYDGQVDVVYVHSPDRLARRYAYQALLLDEFKRRGVEVRFASGSRGDSAEDELLVQVQGVIAEYERAKILERSRRGKLHLARMGDVGVLSCAPFGYRHVAARDGCRATWQVDLAEARTVRRVFDEYTNGQQSLRSIGLGLEVDGVLARKGGKRWQSSAIHNLLCNPAYMGQAAFGKTESVARSTLRPKRGHPEVPRRSSSRRRPQEEWVMVPVPALVSAEVYQRAQDLLARNLQLPARTKRTREFLLTGLAVCRHCGYACFGVGTGKSSSKYQYYRCDGTHAHRYGGTAVCDLPSVRSGEVDNHVWQVVKDTLQNPQRVLAEWTRRNTDVESSDQMEQAAEQARQTVQRHRHTLVRLQDAYEAQALDLAELKHRSERLRDKIRQAERDLAQTEQELHSRTELRAIAGRVEDFAHQIHDNLDDIGFSEKIKIIRLLVARVEFSKAGITIVFRLPAPPPPPQGEADSDKHKQAQGLQAQSDHFANCARRLCAERQVAIQSRAGR